MLKVIKVIAWPFTKTFRYVKSLNEFLEAPLSIKKGTEKTFIFVTKITGATTGAAGAAKGSIDAAEALVCHDGFCFIVSCVGVAADSLQVMASFAPGPNVTALVTTPISVGCKVFVWCCKRSKLPWGNC
jgi:hypothetical protein